MRILLLVSLITLLYSCTTVEMAKEVTKATKSVKTSVNNIIKNLNDDNDEEVIEEMTNDKKIIDSQIASLGKEKKEKEKIIKEQKKKTKINFLGKTSNEIKLMMGEPKLLRIDGNSRTLRYDNSLCQLFLFSNAKTKNYRVKYFEIRNKKGKLIINEEKIDRCYKNFKLS